MSTCENMIAEAVEIFRHTPPDVGLMVSLTAGALIVGFVIGLCFRVKKAIDPLVLEPPHQVVLEEKPRGRRKGESKYNG